MSDNVNRRYDVVILGAGLAGAAAAAALSAHGLNTLIVEARARPGGRGYARPFANTAEPLEFGGAWITPWQFRIRALAKKHGVELRPRHPVMERRWFRDGELHHDWPASTIDYAAHEHAVALIAAHTALLKAGITRDHQGRCFNDISFNAYLELIDAPVATRHLASAWWTVSGNGDKDRVPATELLHSIGYADGTLDGMCQVWADTLVGGVQTLTARMIAASGASCHWGAAATRISHDDNGVRVTLSDGVPVEARAAIVATGLNPMTAISFDPPLSTAKSRATTAGHLGRAVKVWAKVEGVPVGVLATGNSTGIEWMLSERLAADGATFIVGFGVAANGWEPRIPDDVEVAVRRFFPEGRFIAADWHDWNGDLCSRGTWVAGILGQAESYAASTWAREGNLAFASSDFASAEAGWFEAAIISGEAAAAEIINAIGEA